MRYPSYITLLLCAIIHAPSLASAEELAAPFSKMSFEEALRRATTEKKLVVVDFYTNWCGPCKMLDRKTWSDAKVQALLLEKAISLKMDAEKEIDLSKRYSVDAYPTVAIIRPDGSLQDKYVGYMPPEEFIRKFEATLAGKSTLDLAKEAVDKARQQGLEEEVQARLNQAQELARAGKQADALAEYLWCFDEGMPKVPGFAGVRLSFLLNYWKQLAETYPPALEAMKQHRDAAKRRFMESEKEIAAGRDYSALSKELGELREILATFDTFTKGDPRRRALGLELYDQLMKRKSYEEALEVRDDATFERMFARSEKEAKGEGFAKKHPEIADYSQKRCVKEGATRITLYSALGRNDAARALYDRVLKIDDSESARKTLDQALATTPINNSR